ncbi:ParB/RepB/Spo0J family partition protein [Actinacidiphila bryophytorum]|uniref:Transcriptional regulator NovG n=1 Tax=Actinacidiphila bryophytorum TaxID=1436133 RepID=A0A9W4H8K9_9ACTN|nr:ParB/RepB/Spo0J family partition protein [Actinacidiphila bryophytorum]MBM9438315.1 ParB-like nuclease domain-containing protein [Actinacidiphila bryophytorum]MBN6544615.1 ParB-like nuclease domain-containing protein [Actinacidiphila bryophytorum]CAG7657989.1 Transcriptional regulator NovG [Actinacidiphila bryophytorum]
MSLLPNGDGSWDSLSERPSRRRTQVVPISSLLPADSPRLAGETAEHARALAESQAPLPPIVVHRATMRVVDGTHRLLAAVLRGDEYIEARLVDGTDEDIFVLAVKLNAEHGLPLSRQDRTAAAVRIAESHPHWSDRRIASVTGLSPGAVGSLRTRAAVAMPQFGLRTGLDGRNRPVNGAAGRIAASKAIAESPDAPLREIARRAGVALATARDVRNRMRLGQDPVPPKLRPAAGQLEQDAALEPAAPAPLEPARPEPARQEAARPEPAAAGMLSEKVLARMRRDPSLRMSQAGRELLHLLASHLLTDAQRQDLAAGVPAHRAADVANAARLCADRWLQFASDLEVRRAEGAERSPARGEGDLAVAGVLKSRV